MTDFLLTAAQMRALERAAIESGAVTGLELMERAGAGAVEAILAEWPELAEGPRRAVVLCGPGNNGGDGFVVARLLKERGWEVECFLYGNAERLPPDARTNWERWTEDDPEGPTPLEDDLIVGFMNESFDLYVDAVFGTGLSRPLSAELVRTLRRARGIGFSDTRRVALDVPSGLCADSGRLLPAELGHDVDLTVSFATAKVGQYLADGPISCGNVVVVDIGLDVGHRALASLLSAECGGAAFRSHHDLPRVVERPVTHLGESRLEKGRSPAKSHKFDHGHALVLAGGVGRGGAARLAARAALRIGAGLVTVAPPPAALIENASRMDAIMLRAVRDADALGEMLTDERLNALCLGPGLGTGEREAALVARAVSSGRPAVLDGDALTLIAREGELAEALHDRCVMTPHMGEFARLAPDLAERLAAPAETGPAYSRLDAARALAARLGCTILLKGPDTVIAEPSGRAAIHAAAYGREAPWLATAGAGDVLAGLVTGLLARGLDPMAACEAAAWLHVEAARAFGPGLIAEDLPERLPEVLASLEA